MLLEGKVAAEGLDKECRMWLKFYR